MEKRDFTGWLHAGGVRREDSVGIQALHVKGWIQLVSIGGVYQMGELQARS
jgi:hypothetical protein